MTPDNKIAKRMFVSAQQFERAASLLEKNISVKNYHAGLGVQPFITCGTFALELHLKCLLAIATGNHVTGHRMTVLFGKLPRADKDGILAHIRKVYRDQSVPLSFIDDRLKLMDNAFVEWRYLHEAKKISIDSRFLGRMIWACQQHTRTLRPKWFANYP